jgi:hypothetical protein
MREYFGVGVFQVKTNLQKLFWRVIVFKLENELNRPEMRTHIKTKLQIIVLIKKKNLYLNINLFMCVAISIRKLTHKQTNHTHIEIC